MQRIVVALDGSVHAEKALKLAIDLAAKSDAELVLLNVLSDKHLSEAERHMAEVEHLDELSDVSGLLQAPGDPRSVAEWLLHGSVTVTKRVRDVYGRRLLETAGLQAKKGGVSKVQTMIEDGDPAGTILRVAQACHADMIVMGSRGLGGAEGLLMGSVSHKVGQLAECTCVTVK